MSSGGVSVIIPHRNDVDGLDRCLAALAALAQGPQEIIIADNASAQEIGVLETLIERHHPLPIRLVQEPLQGAAPARNTAVAAATGSVLAFLDCDCRPRADWLQRGCDLLASHAVAGGPVVVSWEAGDGPITPAAAFDLLFGFDVARSYRRHQHVLTSNMWVRRDVFEAVGPFRQNVSEDVEWCHRAALKGYRLAFDPHLVVFHRALSERAQLNARWRRITRETWLYGQQRGQTGLGWIARCLAVAGSIPVHGARLLFDQRLSGARLRIAAFAVLADVRLRRAAYGLSLQFRAPHARAEADSKRRAR